MRTAEKASGSPCGILMDKPVQDQNYDQPREHASEGMNSSQENISRDLDSSDPLPNRRSFLQSLLSHSVVAAETAYMILPLAYLKLAERTDSVAQTVSSDGSYPFTDSAHALPGSVELRNLGVVHTPEQYEVDKEHLLEAIRQSDVVLLERGAYFDILAEEASDLGKPVYCIDYYNVFKMEQSLLISPFIAAAAGGWLGLDYATSQLSDNKDLYPKIRRSLARVMGYIHANTSFPSPQLLAHTEFTPEQYPASDMSFLIDGRTVKMLDHVHEISSLNPGKQILAITGDVHASGIEYYFKHPRLFEAKKAFYDIVYDGYHHSSSL